MTEDRDMGATPAKSETDEYRMRNEKRLAMVNELSPQFASLHFKAHEMAKKIRTLERNSDRGVRCREGCSLHPSHGDGNLIIIKAMEFA